MMSSDSVVKHLRTEDLMDDLMELQVAVGLRSFLQDLQTLWRRFRARRTVARLCSWCKRLRIYSREGWFGANLARLTDLVGISPEVIEEQIVMGHEDLS